MDSMAQIGIGLSEPFWMIRSLNVIYKQTKRGRANLRVPLFKNRSPDDIREWSLYQSELKRLAQITRTIRIATKTKKSNQNRPESVLNLQGQRQGEAVLITFCHTRIHAVVLEHTVRP